MVSRPRLGRSLHDSIGQCMKEHVLISGSASPTKPPSLSISGLLEGDVKSLKVLEMHNANSSCTQAMETSLNTNEHGQTGENTPQFLETEKVLRCLTASKTQDFCWQFKFLEKLLEKGKQNLRVLF